MSAPLAAAVERAKARLDTLDYYPEPVRIERVRIFVAPWFFRIPGFRRYHGYAFWRTILLKSADTPDDLVTHELCHVWQGQHRALDMALKHMTTRYRSNPYEIEARGRSTQSGFGDANVRRPSIEGHRALIALPTFIECCGVRLLSLCLP